MPPMPDRIARAVLFFRVSYWGMGGSSVRVGAAFGATWQSTVKGRKPGIQHQQHLLDLIAMH